jgi:hypothetical protein
MSARKDNSLGQSLRKLLLQESYTISTPCKLPHFYTEIDCSDTLNFAIISNVLSNSSLRIIRSQSSFECSPVLLNIRGPLEAEENEPNFLYREDNWKLFQNYLANNLNFQCSEQNYSKTEFEVAVKYFTNTSQ